MRTKRPRHHYNGTTTNRNWSRGLLQNSLFSRLSQFQRTLCKFIKIDLSKQDALDVDPKTTQQINSAENLDQDRNTTMFSNTEEAKETILDFSQGTMRIL